MIYVGPSATDRDEPLEHWLAGGPVRKDGAETKELAKVLNDQSPKGE